MKKRIASMFFAVSAIILVSGCSSSDSTPPPTTLTGTAATGAPIDGTVFVKDAKGVEKSIATAADGSFTLDVPDMTPPYLLKVTPSTGPELYSFASKNGQTVNLTPTTNLAMFLAYGKNDLNTLYVGWDGTGVAAAAIETAEGTVRANLVTEMTAKGLDVASYNLFTTAFSADGTGIDGVMDNLRIAIDSAAPSGFTFTDGSGADMGFDDTLTPPAPPATPAPADAISIVTASGKSHTLNGTYKTVCYSPDPTGSQIDSVTITGPEWVTAQDVYTSSDCTGVPVVSTITATLTKNATQPQTISGWVNGPGVAPDTADPSDGGATLKDDESVTALNLTVTAVTGAFSNFISVGFAASLFYVFDDTGSGFVMYRDDDGLPGPATVSDPFVLR